MKDRSTAHPVVEVERSSAWAEVSLGAIKANIETLRAFLGSGVRILVAAKADAYGHGALPCALAAEEAGVEGFGVAFPEEALELRLGGVRGRIVVLSPVLPAQAKILLEAGAEAVVGDAVLARDLGAAAKAADRLLAVHLKVDTGMGRLGCRPKEAPALAQGILETPGLRLAGLMTHFPAAENDREFTLEQTRVLVEIGRRLAQAGIRVPMHAANSAGLLLYRETHLDMVRPGLAVYGIAPVVGELPCRLEPALSLRALVTQVRRMMPGETLSYGRMYTAREERTIATIPVGYGDGYVRALSGKAQVLIRGRRCPVVGAICMDQTLVDVTGLHVRPGEVATLIGEDGGERITATELAGLARTTPHEVTCLLSKRVPRRYC